MKKIILLIISIIVSFYSLAQEKFIITGGTIDNQYYVDLYQLVI